MTRFQCCLVLPLATPQHCSFCHLITYCYHEVGYPFLVLACFLMTWPMSSVVQIAPVFAQCEFDLKPPGMYCMLSPRRL